MTHTNFICNFYNQFSKLTIFVCTAILVISCQSPRENLAQRPVDLRLDEGFTQRLGHHSATPSFSWRLPESDRTLSQGAYQVQVASHSFASTAVADLWDSGKVYSPQKSWIVFEGKPLSSRQKVYWRVRYWDTAQRASAWSATQHFELGLLHTSDWKGKWISLPDPGEVDDSKYQNPLYRPQYLRFEFDLQKPITQARLYTTSKGIFEAYLNGHKVGDDRMTPGFTPYQKRIETLTYDVTQNLQQGKNTIGAILAEGWYAGRVFGPTKRDHVPAPRFLSQLEVTYADGTADVITSNEHWKSTNQGPLRFASNYDGERYDEQMAMPGWYKNGFDDRDWQAVFHEPISSAVELEPKRHSTVKDMLTLQAKQIVTANDQSVIFDMGQNMVGVPRIRVPGVAKQTITIRFAEALEKGEFYTKNYRSAHSTNYYTPKQDGMVDYQPRFTFHGYRYVELSGFAPNAKPALDWVEGIVQYSDFPLFSNFKSSHTKLNQLFRNVEWGLRGNFLDIPTDCPQRDERMGWTGDAQVFAATSMYLADVYPFWSAWLKSVREEQTDDGMIPKVVPLMRLEGASSGWGDVATVIPWELYMLTGDKRVLQDNYEMMKRWLDYHASQATDHISNMASYGDWLQPFPELEGKPGQRGDTHKSYIGTAYYARSVDLTLEAAQVLGKEKDVAALSQLLGEIKQRFLAHFFDPQLNVKVGKATQTVYLMALGFDLLPENARPMAEKQLMRLIVEADYHLRTGFLGTPLLAPVLESMGRSDVMYTMLFKETYPSWFYSINQGATTMWERWNSYSIEDGFSKASMNSLNHYAYGAIAEWFYEGLLGLKVKEPGFKSYRIDPQMHAPLQHAAGSYQSAHGTIDIAWETKTSGYDLTLTVAPNTLAEVVLRTDDADNIEINDQPLKDFTSNTDANWKTTNPQMSLLSDVTPGRYQIRVRK